jgi:hypothetical protein
MQLLKWMVSGVHAVLIARERPRCGSCSAWRRKWEPSDDARSRWSSFASAASVPRSKRPPSIHRSRGDQDGGTQTGEPRRGEPAPPPLPKLNHAPDKYWLSRAGRTRY